jgi:O-antigen ligase/tetratricopeptide (TPR) repeat protein
LLVAHLVLCPLVFCPWTLEAFEFNKALLLRAVALVFAAAGLCAAVGTGNLVEAVRGLHFRRPLQLGFLLLLVSGFASTAWSISPHTSLHGVPESEAGFLTLLACTVLFFATFALCRTAEDCRRLLVAPVAATAVVSGYAVVQLLGYDPLPWKRTSTYGGLTRWFATLGHANHLAAYLVMSWPLVLFFAQQAGRRRRWRRLALLIALAALSSFVLVLTLSRGAWLAFACMSAVLVLGWFGTGWRRAALAFSAVVPLAVVGLLVLAARGGHLSETLSQRVQGLSYFGGRQHLWRAGWHLFRDHPVVGSGLDTYQLAFGRYRTPDYMQVEWDTTPTRAHNEAVHILATQGILGAAAVLVMTAGLVLAGRRAWRTGDPEDRALLAALYAGVIGFGAHGLFSFTVLGYGTLFVTFAAVLARLDAPAGSALPERGCGGMGLGRRILQAGVGLAAVLCGVNWIALPFAANCLCRQADKETSHALRKLERVVALDPEVPLYWVKLSQAAEWQALTATELAEHQRLLRRARQALETAVALASSDPYVHHNLGRLLGRLAREGLASPGDAYAELDTALRNDPVNAVFLADAADVALGLGDLPRTRAYAERGHQLYPVHAPFLGHLGYLALLDKQYAQAAELLHAALAWGANGLDGWKAAVGTCLARALLGLDRYEEALQAASVALEHAEVPDARYCRGQALELLGRPAEAAEEYRRLLGQQPEHGPARAALARLQSTSR